MAVSSPPPPSPPVTTETLASDDDYTLYSDTGSIYSRSNVSTSSFASYNVHDKLPALYVSLRNTVVLSTFLLIPSQPPIQSRRQQGCVRGLDRLFVE